MPPYIINCIRLINYETIGMQRLDCYVCFGGVAWNTDYRNDGENAV